MHIRSPLPNISVLVVESDQARCALLPLLAYTHMQTRDLDAKQSKEGEEKQQQQQQQAGEGKEVRSFCVRTLCTQGIFKKAYA